MYMYTINEYFILYFLYSLSTIVVFYLVSVFLFPREPEDIIKLEKYFTGNTTWIYLLFTLLFISLIMNSQIYKEHDLFHFQNYVRAFAGFLTLLVAVNKKKLFRHIVLGICWIIFIAYILKVEYYVF